MQENKKKLKALGLSSKNQYNYSPPKTDKNGNPLDMDAILEHVPFNKRKGLDSEITLNTNEFTSLCPVTGQPDFGEIEIVYTPDKRIVETKSLKLYLMQFRQFGFFQEEIVQQICFDLSKLLEPEKLKVAGFFSARGGIKITAAAEYNKSS